MANTQISLRLTQEQLSALDEMRRREKDIPNRQEMLRRMLGAALAAAVTQGAVK